MKTNLPSAYPRDSRSDLGYGRSSRSSRFNPRKENISFPYEDPFNEPEYTEEEEEMANDIADRIRTPRGRSDMIPSYDRSSYQDIIKISEIAKGISPFPRMYKKRDGHLGGSPRPISGTHAMGFDAKSTPTGHAFDREPLEDDSEEHIYSLEDLALSQLRECIKLMILEYS